MPRTKPFAELQAQVMADPVRRERVITMKRAMRDAMALAELRGRSEASQTAVDEPYGSSAVSILHIEHEEDGYLSTLRDYVAALGGTLEVNAVFADGTVTLAPPSNKDAGGSWDEHEVGDAC